MSAGICSQYHHRSLRAHYDRNAASGDHGSACDNRTPVDNRTPGYDASTRDDQAAPRRDYAVRPVGRDA